MLLAAPSTISHSGAQKTPLNCRPVKAPKKEWGIPQQVLGITAAPPLDSQSKSSDDGVQTKVIIIIMVTS